MQLDTEMWKRIPNDDNASDCFQQHQQNKLIESIYSVQHIYYLETYACAEVERNYVACDAYDSMCLIGGTVNAQGYVDTVVFKPFKEGPDFAGVVAIYVMMDCMAVLQIEQEV